MSKTLIELSPLTTSEKLSRYKADIIDNFVIEAQNNIEAARKISRDGVKDSLDDFLETLIRSLKTGVTEESKGSTRQIGANHGMIRCQQRVFSADDIFMEYRILTRIIFKTLRNGAFLLNEAEEILTDGILRYLGNAVSNYTKLKTFSEKEFKLSQTTRLAQALENSDSELQDFFLEAKVPMFITVGKKHRFMLANKAFEDLLHKKVGGENLSSLDNVYHLKKAMDEAFEKNHSLYESVDLAGKEGIRIYLHPYHDDKGLVKGIRGMVDY